MKPAGRKDGFCMPINQVHVHTWVLQLPCFRDQPANIPHLISFDTIIDPASTHRSRRRRDPADGLSLKHNKCVPPLGVLYILHVTSAAAASLKGMAPLAVPTPAVAGVPEAAAASGDAGIAAVAPPECAACAAGRPPVADDVRVRNCAYRCSAVAAMLGTRSLSPAPPATQCQLMSGVASSPHIRLCRRPVNVAWARRAASALDCCCDCCCCTWVARRGPPCGRAPFGLRRLAPSVGDHTCKAAANSVTSHRCRRGRATTMECRQDACCKHYAIQTGQHLHRRTQQCCAAPPQARWRPPLLPAARSQWRTWPPAAPLRRGQWPAGLALPPLCRPLLVAALASWRHSLPAVAQAHCQCFRCFRLPRRRRCPCPGCCRRCSCQSCCRCGEHTLLGCPARRRRTGQTSSHGPGRLPHGRQMPREAPCHQSCHTCSSKHL